MDDKQLKEIRDLRAEIHCFTRTVLPKDRSKEDEKKLKKMYARVNYLENKYKMASKETTTEEEKELKMMMKEKLGVMEERIERVIDETMKEMIERTIDRMTKEKLEMMKEMIIEKLEMMKME